MVAPRRSVDLFGRRGHRDFVFSIDWTRVLIEARGLHMRRYRDMEEGHVGILESMETCGDCLCTVLLTLDDTV